MDKNKLKKYINKIIFDDDTIKANNFYEIYKILEQIFSNRRFISNLSNLKVNWIDIPSNEVINYILEYMKGFSEVIV